MYKLINKLWVRRILFIPPFVYGVISSIIYILAINDIIVVEDFKIFNTAFIISLVWFGIVVLLIIKSKNNESREVLKNQNYGKNTN